MTHLEPNIINNIIINKELAESLGYKQIKFEFQKAQSQTKDAFYNFFTPFSATEVDEYLFLWVVYKSLFKNTLLT